MAKTERLSKKAAKTMQPESRFFVSEKTGYSITVIRGGDHHGERIVPHYMTGKDLRIFVDEMGEQINNFLNFNDQTNNS